MDRPNLLEEFSQLGPEDLKLLKQAALFLAEVVRSSPPELHLADLMGPKSDAVKDAVQLFKRKTKQKSSKLLEAFPTLFKLETRFTTVFVSTPSTPPAAPPPSRKRASRPESSSTRRRTPKSKSAASSHEASRTQSVSRSSRASRETRRMPPKATSRPQAGAGGPASPTSPPTKTRGRKRSLRLPGRRLPGDSVFSDSSALESRMVSIDLSQLSFGVQTANKAGRRSQRFPRPCVQVPSRTRDNSRLDATESMSEVRVNRGVSKDTMDVLVKVDLVGTRSDPLPETLIKGQPVSLTERVFVQVVCADGNGLFSVVEPGIPDSEPKVASSSSRTESSGSASGGAFKLNSPSVGESKSKGYSSEASRRSPEGLLHLANWKVLATHDDTHPQGSVTLGTNVALTFSPSCTTIPRYYACKLKVMGNVARKKKSRTSKTVASRSRPGTSNKRIELSSMRFHALCVASTPAGTKSIREELAATSPFEKRTSRRGDKVHVDHLPASERPRMAASLGAPKFLRRAKLPAYKIPSTFPARSRQPDLSLLELPEDQKEAATRWHRLLWYEELAAKDHLLSYSQSDVTFVSTSSTKGSQPQRFWVTLPGLLEGRPSLIPGDLLTVSVQKPDRTSESGGGMAAGASLNLAMPPRLAWEGCVEDVTRDKALVKLTRQFAEQHKSSHSYNVEFQLNRTPLRVQHMHVDIAAGIRPHIGTHVVDLDFITRPTPLHSPTTTTTSTASYRRDLDLVNPSLNGRQRLAVEHILCRDFVAPYVIYGPPGTGKTVTVVEAIHQLLKLRSEDGNLQVRRILVVAPTNAAADVVAERLIKSKQFSPLEAEGLPSSRPASRPTADSESGSPLPWLLRILAYSRLLKTVPVDVRPYCLLSAGAGAGAGAAAEATNFMKPMFPPVEYFELSNLKVVVATAASASKLYSIGVPPAAFDAIVVDEAGRMTEPELLCVLAGLCTRRQRVILAGDPQQLGPVIMSSVASAAGLGVSLLERLCQLPEFSRQKNWRKQPEYGAAESASEQAAEEGKATDLRVSPVSGLSESDLDQTGGFDPRFVTQLVENYRSHPDIIAVPKKLFYDDVLVARGLEQNTHRAIRNASIRKWLPNPTCPVVFHNVRGQEEREARSPSWFNAEEVVTVMSYLQRLFSSDTEAPVDSRIKHGDVGIIAPYAQQLRKIRAILKSRMPQVVVGEDENGLKIGSTEQFQGQERPVIIISTVRSQLDVGDGLHDASAPVLPTGRAAGGGEGGADGDDSTDSDESSVSSDIKGPDPPAPDVPTLGFVANPKRLNVALTRAQALLIVVGNSTVLETDPNWREFINFCKTKGTFVDGGSTPQAEST